MSLHLIRKIDRLKRSLLSLSATVAGSVDQTIAAARSRDFDAAQAVVEGDARIEDVLYLSKGEIQRHNRPPMLH